MLSWAGRTSMADLSVFLPWSFNGLAAGLSGGGPRYRIQRGTVLFTDVAGFTPLTEALSVLGREGAEELTRILNAYFTRMIAIADEEGGDVLRFGGDSMTLLFPGEAPGPALRAASRMMEAMSAFKQVPTRAGVYSLSMKIGAAAGPVLLGIVGGEAAGFDFYAAGPPLDGATAAEHQALPGQIVLDASVKGASPAGLRVLARGDRRLLFGSPTKPPRRAGHAPPPPGTVLEKVVPRVLHEFADETVLGEHRGTAVLFVRFDGLPYQAVEEGGGPRVPSLHCALDALYGTFAVAALQHGGYLNKMDMGDKGAKALLLFGSPRALENKEEMAVRAALHLMHSSRLPPGVILRIGLTSAPLFAGPLGAPHRREYTAMGNGINLAARLMQQAGPGQIRCDEATARAVRSFDFRPLPPVRLKGLKDPVPVFEPEGEREETLLEGGRLLERGEIQKKLLRHLLKGEGPPLLLRADAGLGKTALLEWALALVKEKGRTCVRVPLGPHSRGKAYAAWRGPLRAALGVRHGSAPAEIEIALAHALPPTLRPFAPLLRPLLDLSAVESSATEPLGPGERKELTAALIKAIFERCRGWAVLLDNLHFADPLSRDLLASLSDAGAHSLFRVAASLRPGFPEAENALPGAEVLDLPPLSERGILRLLTDLHGLIPPEKPVARWFVARSRGNPAVVGALLTALEAEGLVQRGDYGARIDGDRLFKTRFPDTLEGLYLAPVDLLRPEEKKLLQQASVLGDSVSVNLLKEAAGLDSSTLAGLLDALQGSRLLLTDTWGERPYVRFADTMLRDAVYEAAPFEVKREIHARLAHTLEAEGNTTPKLWPVLARHFRAAGEEAQARRYDRLAGRDAYERADNVSAFQHLERVCASLSPEPEDVEDAFRFMDACESLGRWADARPVLAALERLDPKLPLPHRARLRNYMAIQDPDEAEAHLLEGIRLAQACGNVLLEAKARLNLVGRVYGPTGRIDEATRELHSVLASPDVPGMVLLKGISLMNLGNALWFGGDPKKGETQLRKAANLLRRTGFAHRETQAANNLSALLGETGEFVKGAWWARRAINRADLFAQRAHQMGARLNLVSSLLAMGETRQASAHIETCSALAQAQGQRIDLAHALQRRAYLALLDGDGNRLAVSSREAVALFCELSQLRDAASSAWSYARYCRQLRSPELWGTFVDGLPHDHLPQIASCDESWARLFSALQSWASKEEGSPDDLFAAFPPGTDSLESVLFLAESCLEHLEAYPGRPCLQRTLIRLHPWHHFEGEMASLLLRKVGGSRWKQREKKHLGNKLWRCAGGVHGLRLLGLLFAEGSLAPRPYWERLVRQRLAFFRDRNPTWAWEALLRFPEVKTMAARLGIEDPR